MQEQDQELYSVPAVSAMLQSIRDSFTESRRGICKFRQWLDSWVSQLRAEEEDEEEEASVEVLT